jgi:hypothetical protein
MPLNSHIFTIFSIENSLTIKCFSKFNPFPAMNLPYISERKIMNIQKEIVNLRVKTGLILTPFIEHTA